MKLTREDRAHLKAAAEALPLEEVRDVRHFFSFLFNLEGALAAVAELHRRCENVQLFEELSGDDYWHICAHRRQTLLDRAVINAKREMGAIAARHGGTYDGWAATRWGAAVRPRRKT